MVMVETKSRKSKKKKPKQANRSSPVDFFGDKVVKVVPFLRRGGRTRKRREKRKRSTTLPLTNKTTR